MKIVVAYSGGLDTSVIVKWVKETYNAEVICYCADVGQQEELDGLEAKAIATGASKCIIDDLNEEFARDFIFPMLQGEAIYESNYLLGTSIARPLIAKRLVEVAKAEGADAICHGATGKGNDQVRFELNAKKADRLWLEVSGNLSPHSLREPAFRFDNLYVIRLRTGQQKP